MNIDVFVVKYRGAFLETNNGGKKYYFFFTNGPSLMRNNIICLGPSIEMGRSSAFFNLTHLKNIYLNVIFGH